MIAKPILPPVAPSSSASVAISLPEPGVWTWVILWFFALASRFLAAIILPNAEQDGYSYVETIARWTDRLATGQFRLADLFGFWLPLFQFASAILNLWIHDPLIAGKVLNGLCGASTCVTVFAITARLTRSLAFGFLAFFLLLFDPLHILYSAACMTDIPHVALVVGSIWFVLQKRWIPAAILGALAESVRLEAWALLPVIPLIQLAVERRVSLLAIGILLVPPLAWLGVGYLAAGDPLAYFAKRATYQASYIDFHPTRQGFARIDVLRDLDYFLLGANATIFFSSAAAIVTLIWRSIRAAMRPCWACAAIAAYGLALLGALFFAYISKGQPVIFPRYGLLFFVIGLPLFARLLQFLFGQPKRLWPKLLAVSLVVLCLWQMKSQVPVIFKVLDDFRAHQRVAEVLKPVMQQYEPGARCFSDDVALRVITRQPVERFLSSPLVPEAARKNRAAFESYLRDEHVAHLVFVRTEDSLPVQFYPELGRSEMAKTGRFELVTMARSSFGPDLWLYHLHAAAPVE